MKTSEILDIGYDFDNNPYKYYLSYSPHEDIILNKLIDKLKIEYFSNDLDIVDILSENYTLIILFAESYKIISKHEKNLYLNVLYENCKMTQKRFDKIVDANLKIFDWMFGVER